MLDRLGCLRLALVLLCWIPRAGALSIPLEEIEARLSELPGRREIVAYCRGPYCVLAIEAVRRLREKGFRAVRFDMGVWDWRAKGLKVLVGEE